MTGKRNQEAACNLEISRRDLLKTSWLAPPAWAATGNLSLNPIQGAEPVAPDQVVPLNRFPRMVQEYFVEKVRQAERSGLARQSALNNKRDAEAYVLDVRSRIRRCFGPEPERTPLNARVSGVVERDTYRIEKVIFESRPQFFVPANLYIPKGRKLPLPGVVGSCGHSENGKANEMYQSFAQGLARLGFVVLIFDPAGQGERLQYVTPEFKPRRGTGTAEHLYAGNQQFLVGEFFGAWRAWDGIRALDYLLTRSEVDPRHVGITGNSGGGTMTTWLCGLDPRWTMAAAGCFVTTFRRNMENELPADTEQCPPAVLAAGLDHSDFMAAMAPKPVIILAKERDYFDVRGAIEAYERLKRLYALLGAPDHIALSIGPTEHGYTKENREAMYRWFQRATGMAPADSEPPLQIEKDETLWCTPHGQIAELNPRTLFSFTREKSEALGRKRQALSSEGLNSAVLETLRLGGKPPQPPDYRILRPLGKRGYKPASASVYAVETEPGIFALVYRLSPQSHYSRPPESGERAFLYVSHHSADEELRSEPLIRDLIASEPSMPFYTCDVRGIGESRPDTCGSESFSSPYGSDYFYAVHSIMLDRPYLGQKAWDVLRVLDWLAAAGHTKVHVAGKGWGSLPAAFAALLNDHVTQVTLKGAPDSYAAMAEREEYSWPLSCLIPGVLSVFDLPDCYRELEKTKKLRRL